MRNTFKPCIHSCKHAVGSSLCRQAKKQSASARLCRKLFSCRKSCLCFAASCRCFNNHNARLFNRLHCIKDHLLKVSWQKTKSFLIQSIRVMRILEFIRHIAIPSQDPILKTLRHVLHRSLFQQNQRKIRFIACNPVRHNQQSGQQNLPWLGNFRQS